MMKKQHRSYLLAVLFIAVCGSVKVSYSYDLLLLLPPILAGARQGTDNTVGWQPLNDTGITWSGNYISGNNSSCVALTTSYGDNVVAAQDCSHGRDADYDDDSDGHAGFSFIKLDSDGQPLINQNADYASMPWACVQDNVTGLIWEVKSDDDGLHDKDDKYTWYNTDSTSNGGDEGYSHQKEDVEPCFGYESGNPPTYCNTQAYVNRVNTAGWCGASDWRMPTRKELESLVAYNRNNPSIDTNYFPHAASSSVWSGSPDAYNTNYVWSVSFSNGFSSSDQQYRSGSYAIRLVRSEQ